MAFRVFVVLMLSLTWLRAMAASGELVFGVYPYLSPTQTVNTYAPLRDYVAKTLERPVGMVSAPGFPAFIERTRAGSYDIVFTAPHMGRLAEKQDGWRRVAQTGYQILIVVLVQQGSDIRRLEDLKGKTIAVGARDSMTFQLVDEALGARGLKLERDVKVKETASFSNVIHALIRGEADAGATSMMLWNAAPTGQRTSVREIFESQPVPGFLIMAHPRLGEAAIGRLRQALVEYKDTPGGAAFFAMSQHIDFRPIDDMTMRRIDPYTTVLMHAH